MSPSFAFLWPLLIPIFWLLSGWCVAYWFAPRGWQDREPIYGCFMILVCGAIAGPLLLFAVCDEAERD
jgi:hypothetical protein